MKKPQFYFILDMKVVERTLFSRYNNLCASSGCQIEPFPCYHNFVMELVNNSPISLESVLVKLYNHEKLELDVVASKESCQITTFLFALWLYIIELLCRLLSLLLQLLLLYLLLLLLQSSSLLLLSIQLS